MENNDIIRHQIFDGSQKERASRIRIFCGVARRGCSRAKALLKRVGGIFMSELRSNATPGKAAGSFALGIFFGIFPIFGFQTVAAILAAKAFKFNSPLAVLGTVVLIPFIIPTVFAAVWLGTVIFPAPDGAARNLQALMALFSESKSAFFMEGGKYFITGCTIIAILAGGLAYIVVYPVCKWFKERVKRHERN